MGQAAVDLPDPLESPPFSPASTDDLLAQLAGEEIERLLADADEPPSRPGATAPLSLPAVTAPSGESALVDSLLQPPAATTAPQEHANDSAANADLNALFTQLSSSSPNPASSATDQSAIGPPVESQPPTLPVASDSEASAAEALAREILEDESLTASARAGLSMASTSPASADTTQVAKREGEDSIPLVLRLLNWLSAPLDCCSDRTRQLVGKIAILTTINSLAVLGYVLFFRHR